MDEIKLNTFIVVSRTGSFTSAAEELYLTPISVKKQIDSLETELGDKLFLRKATGCTLTPSGELFLIHAKKIVEDIETAKREIENISINNRGEILAGHNITFNYKFVGSLSTGFSESHENCIIQFQKYPRKDLVDLLLKRQINCIFAESTLIEEKDTLNIDFYPLVSLPVYAIMAKNNPSANNGSFSIEQLQDKEIYVSKALRPETVDLISNAASSFAYIDETDRNILFNRIIKGAIEIYPRQFSYYSCIPLNVDPVVIGIYTLKNQSELIDQMVVYAKDYINKYEEADEIM